MRSDVMCLALLATVTLIVGVAGCAVVTVPEGVIRGVDLPSDLSLVLREGMSQGEVIARFGAPARHTRLGQTTTIVYSEEVRAGHQQVRLFWTPVGPDRTTRTQLHLVFLNDSLEQAWVDVAGKGREPETHWVLGAPKVEDGSSAPPPVP